MLYLPCAVFQSAESAKSSLCPANRGEVTLPELLDLPEMLKEADGMPNETNGNSVKCEIGNVKAEMKEEAVKSVEPESGGIPPQNSNPMPNGEVGEFGLCGHKSTYQIRFTRREFINWLHEFLVSYYF